MKLTNDILKYCGQGENPDLSFLVSEFDKQTDKYFGINYHECEKEIKNFNEDIYPDLKEEALLTSYLDYYQIFTELGENSKIVDLGAGYCRGTLLSEFLSYPLECISIEVACSRTTPAKKFLKENNLKEELIRCEDILDSSFKIPDTDYIFLYLPTGKLVNSFLRQLLSNRYENVVVYVIESHGDLVDTLSFYPEFFDKLDSSLKTSTQRHDQTIHKYRIKNVLKVIDSYNDLKRVDIQNINTLPLWMIKYSDQDMEVSINSKVPGKTSPRQWRANIQNSRLVRYNKEVGLALDCTNRILQLESQDQIIP